MKEKFDMENPEHIQYALSNPVCIVMERFYISTNRVAKIRKDNGVAFKRKRNYFDENNPEHIKDLELTARIIARKYSISTTSIHQLRKKYGIISEEEAQKRKKQQKEEEAQSWRDTYVRTEMNYSDGRPAFPEIFNKKFV